MLEEYRILSGVGVSTLSISASLTGLAQLEEFHHKHLTIVR
jgi:hypothetical protein